MKSDPGLVILTLALLVGVVVLIYALLIASGTYDVLSSIFDPDAVWYGAADPSGSDQR